MLCLHFGYTEGSAAQKRSLRVARVSHGMAPSICLLRSQKQSDVAESLRPRLRELIRGDCFIPLCLKSVRNNSSKKPPSPDLQKLERASRHPPGRRGRRCASCKTSGGRGAQPARKLWRSKGKPVRPGACSKGVLAEYLRVRRVLQMSG